MAIKTLILRPVSITATDESLVTLYPTDTAMANAHTLVGEETADDDATYITGGLGGVINYYFSFTKPEDLKEVTGFSFKVRYMTESGSSTVDFQLYLSSYNYTLCSSTNSITAYTDASSAFTSDDMNAIVGKFNSTTSNLDFYVTQTVATGNKLKPTRVTQMYIEVTYQDNAGNIVYLKQNDEWIKLNEPILYRRYNNKWSLLDLSIMTDGSNYIMREVE